MKLSTAIKNACEELKKYQIKNPLLDSEILISKAIKRDREFIALNFNEEINEKDYIYFKKLISDRSKGKPVAYIIGKKAFWNYEFKINKNVLIPRPDTEILVEQVLKETYINCKKKY